MENAETDPRAAEIVGFWLGDSVLGPEQAEQRRALWYNGGKALDDTIAARFGDDVEGALARERDHWTATPQGTLALVIVLDQFTRNSFRFTPRAFAGDAHALRLAEGAVARGDDRVLPVMGRIFLYHPFHHGESLQLQDRGVSLVDAIRRDVDASWHAFLDRRVAGFTRHRNIVARFGRFPHRNAALGRDNTPEEEAYLAGEHESFGQGNSRRGTPPPR